MKKIVYVYSELPTYIRIKKNIQIFSEVFDEVYFIGANRNATAVNLSGFPSNSFFKIYDKKISHGGIRSAIDSIGFAFFALREMRKIDCDTIVFVNEELLWLSMFLPKKTKINLICEILDSLAIRIVGPLQKLNFFFRLYCDYFYKKCNSLIEVSKHRIDYRKYKHKNVYLIPNRPIPLSNTEKYCNSLDGLKFIYVSGSVLEGISGVEFLLEAIKRLEHLGIKIVYSGRLHGPWAEANFFNNKNVINLGNLKPEESISVAQSSIAIFAYYKDVNMNYVLASPNKLSDAIMIGKPILMNTECFAKFTAKDAGILYEARYNDVDALCDNVLNIFNLSESESKEMSKDSRKYFSDNFSEKMIINNWYAVLNVTSREG